MTIKDMTAKESQDIPQNPVILRCHRIMEAFAKSDDERDFYLDRVEGFLLYADLDKSQEEIEEFISELKIHSDRYIPIPKLTFYEVKKLMEGFVNEKVYDIDTKEKLLDIIQSKEARENFLEFIYDHHSEMEKWQQYYQERFRVRIIEWLRNYVYDFVFEEDIELTKSIVERIKINMFTPKVPKDIGQARKILTAKAATYYSSEALNPRPKRGRPPKQVVKVETEPQFSQDIYVAVPKSVKPFLFTPDYHSSSMIFTFSGKFTSEAELLAFRRQQVQSIEEFTTIGQKLAAIRTLSGPTKSDSHIEAERGEILKESALHQHEAISLSSIDRKSTSGNKVKKETLSQKNEVSSRSKQKTRPSAKTAIHKQESKKSAQNSSRAKIDSEKLQSGSLEEPKRKKKSSSDSLKPNKKVDAKNTQKREKQPTTTASAKRLFSPVAPGSKQKMRLRPLVRKQKKTEV